MVKTVRSNWTDAVLICRKCSKKLDGGFGPKGTKSLAKTLRRHVIETTPDDGRKHKGRHARFGVVEVGCLGLCPKRAVTTVRASRPMEWMVVAAETPLPDLIATFGLDPQPRDAAVTEHVSDAPVLSGVTPFPLLSRKSRA